MVLLLLCIAGGSLGVLLHQKRVRAIPLICFILCLALLAVHFGGLLLCRETVSDDLLEKVAAIPWKDEDYLLANGFERRGDALTYDHFVGWSEERDAICFDIWVEKESEEDPADMEVFGDLRYSFERTLLYDNEWCEFFNVCPIGAVRRYQFYINGRWVAVLEQNTENTDKLFEPYLLDEE